MVDTPVIGSCSESEMKKILVVEEKTFSQLCEQEILKTNATTISKVNIKKQSICKPPRKLDEINGAF